MSKENEATELNLEIVQKFLNENEDGKKFLKSHTDSFVTKGIQTYKNNFMEKEFPVVLENEIKKRYPEETPEQKRIRELEIKFAETDKDKQRAILQSKLLKIANEKKIPDFFVDYSLDESEEKSVEKLEKLGQNFTNILNQEIESRLAGSSRKAPVPNDNNPTTVDINNLPNDPEFYKKNSEVLNKMLNEK